MEDRLSSRLERRSAWANLQSFLNSDGVKSLTLWFARVSVLWTAWGVLAQFKTIQDVLASVEAFVANLNERLSWFVGLLFWTLREAAAAFHHLTNSIFESVPWLRLVPHELHSPLVIGLLALAPSVLALARTSRLGSAIAKIKRAYESWSSDVERFALFRAYRRLSRRLPEGHEELDSVVYQVINSDPLRENFSVVREVRVKWAELRMLAERNAAVARSLLGFSVFSLRFYASCFLVVALTWERYSSASTIPLDQPEDWSLYAVWLSVGVAFLIAITIKGWTGSFRRTGVASTVLTLARLFSLPVSERDRSAIEDWPEAEESSETQGRLVFLADLPPSTSWFIDAFILPDPTTNEVAGKLALWDTLGSHEKACFLITAWASRTGGVKASGFESDSSDLFAPTSAALALIPGDPKIGAGEA